MLVIVGDGPLKKEVDDKIRALGLEGSVKLTGLLEDVRPILAAMDAYLVSSDFEGLPIALLEAMAMELFPVATAVGGIPEVLVPGVSGEVVSKGDVAGLSTALEGVLALSASERRSRGAAARHRVADSFSTDRMMREIEAVYRDVVAHG
jgi:glycosyltransferase involved in cell wall biosynthesis